MNTGKEQPKILYDGSCELCKRSVEFIDRHSGDRKFEFVPLQTAEGGKLLEKHGYPKDYNDSVLLVKDHQETSKSDAVFEIIRHLHRPWRWLYVLVILPRPLRNAVYNYISRIRHKRIVQKIMHHPDGV